MLTCPSLSITPSPPSSLTLLLLPPSFLLPPLRHAQVGEDGTGPGGGAGGEKGAGEASVFGGSEAAFPGPRVLVVWLMAVTDGASIGKCFYGAYASEDTPPEKYWLPFADEEKGYDHGVLF